MVQYNTSPASATPEARPLSKLEVFRKLGVTVIDKSIPKPANPAVAKPVIVVEEPEVKEPEPTIVEPEEPTPEATMEVASETTPVEENPAAEEEKITTSISVLQLRKSYANVLTANGINTIEDLAEYIASGKDLSELSGIGATATNSILEKFEAWQNEQN